MEKRHLFILALFLSSIGIYAEGIVLTDPNSGQNSNNFTASLSHSSKMMQPTIKVEANLANSPPISNGDMIPNGFNNTLFSAQFIGASQSKSYRIKNTGSLDLIISNITITGNHPNDFLISLAPNSPIAPHTDSIFEITFSPLASGIRDAVVSITHNDSPQSPYIFAIRGTGLCTATSLSITPTEGPKGSVATIIGTDFSNGTVAAINGISMATVYIDPNTIEVTIPENATTGSIALINDLGCTGHIPFTVIDHQMGGCVGTATLSDLFISEVTDATLGGLNYIELYNATGQSVNLNDYSIAIFSNGSATVSGTVPLNDYNLPNQSTYVIAIGVSATNNCPQPGGAGELANQTSGISGINKKDNEHDVIRLLKSGGTVVVDQFGVYRNSNWMEATNISGDRGFNFRRLNTATLLPNPDFDLDDWMAIDWIGAGTASCHTNDYSDIGHYDFSGGSPPLVVQQPTVPNSNCYLTASLTVLAMKDLEEGPELTYHWFYNEPETANWIEIAPSDPNYSGQQSPTLTIMNSLNVEAYQYYVQVRQQAATCFTASHAARIKIDKTNWDGLQWQPHPPDISTVAILNANYTTTGLADSFTACSLFVSSGQTLQITDNSYVEILKDVVVDANSMESFGQIIVETKGALIQRGDGAEAGKFVLHGAARASVNKTTALKQHWYDYTYWGSPVSHETIESALDMAPVSRRFYFDALNYEDTDGDDIDDNNDVWQLASGRMAPGIGYASTSNNSGSFPRTDTTTFQGVFNTGDIPVTIYTNSIPTDNDWNFVSNPYASAIDFKLIHDANALVVDGIALLWSQAGPPLASNPGNDVLNFSQNDYAIITVGSGNLAGGKNEIPSDFIPSGQGFFVKGINTGGVLTFKNAMRMADTNSNDQFFRPGAAMPNRFWLNLISDNGVFNQVLMAYVAGATNEFDGLAYDVSRNLPSPQSAIIYTKIPEDPSKYAIQGKAVESLSTEEEITIGFQTTITEPTLYTLGIAQIQGAFFEENTIYLKDHKLDLHHNLSAADYRFTSETGDFNQRFSIVFNPQALSVKTQSIQTSDLRLYPLSGGRLQIEVPLPLSIRTVELMDLLGRKLLHFKGKHPIETLDLRHLNQAAYLVKTTLSNGQVIIKRSLIHH